MVKKNGNRQQKEKMFNIRWNNAKDKIESLLDQKEDVQDSLVSASTSVGKMLAAALPNMDDNPNGTGPTPDDFEHTLQCLADAIATSHLDALGIDNPTIYDPLVLTSVVYGIVHALVQAIDGEDAADFVPGEATFALIAREAMTGIKTPQKLVDRAQQKDRTNTTIKVEVGD